LSVTVAIARTLTGARFDADPSELLLQVYEAPHLEREKLQFDEYLQVDLAHTVMLAEQGILRRKDAALLLSALRELARMGVNAFPVDPRKGSLLLQIESWLFDRIGERVGGRMHTGRSRLDQGPTARRLYKRKHLLAVMDALLALQHTVLALAESHATTLMPGYTCLQHAHPGVFGHYLLAFSSKLADDFDRLSAAYGRLNRNPLGAAGLSGTSWPIDRFRTSELLGFDGPLPNSRVAREAYYAAEVAAGLSFVMSTLNDLATDLHLWSTHEFAFIETADEFCGTSSIFPQKKNPAGLEAVKFAAGGATTWLAGALATFRAEGTGDVVMHEVPALDQAFASTKGCLQLMDAVLGSMEVHQEKMARSASGTWATATNLADLLVRSCNVSFREAHSMVARLVRNSLRNGVGPGELTSAHLTQAAAELGLPDPRLASDAIRNSLDAAHFARTRSSYGAIAPEQVDLLLTGMKESVRTQSAWLGGRLAAIARGKAALDAAVEGTLAARAAGQAAPG
jgi:argininosuccinate lyase